MTDKVLYQQIVDEITTGQIDRALWAMVWAEAGGDDNKARASYVQARVREILAERKQARKIENAPNRRRLLGSWAALFICALIAAVVIQAMARGSHEGASTLRWSFYLTGTAAYAVGLLLFPALPILFTRGSRHGFQIAFATLLLVSSFALYGSLSSNPANRPAQPSFSASQETPSLPSVATAEPRSPVTSPVTNQVASFTATPAQSLALITSSTPNSAVSKQTVLAFVKSFLSVKSLADEKTELSYFDFPVQIGVSPRENHIRISSPDLRTMIVKVRQAGPFDYILTGPVIAYPDSNNDDGVWRVSFKVTRTKLVAPYRSALEDYELILHETYNGSSPPFKITAIEGIEEPR